VTPQNKTFEPIAELESDPFRDSLGVHRGPTTKVRLRFDAQIASSIRERVWHSSQQLKDHSDGSITMTLEVCDDYALRSWILGFGRFVRVEKPAPLVDWALEELDQARQQYTSGEVTRVDSDLQPALPFLFGRLANA
jgi:predicted DNA-binding transcriptional regulator YafY